MCKSEPHMAQAVTLMTASRAFSILGSGTSSQRMSALPCQVNAFTSYSEEAAQDAGQRPPGAEVAIDQRNYSAPLSERRLIFRTLIEPFVRNRTKKKLGDRGLGKLAALRLPKAPS